MHELRNEIRKQARKELGAAELGTATVKLDLDTTAFDKACDRIEQRLAELARKAAETVAALNTAA